MNGDPAVDDTARRNPPGFPLTLGKGRAQMPFAVNPQGDCRAGEPQMIGNAVANKEIPELHLGVNILDHNPGRSVTLW